MRNCALIEDARQHTCAETRACYNEAVHMPRMDKCFGSLQADRLLCLLFAILASLFLVFASITEPALAEPNDSGSSTTGVPETNGAPSVEGDLVYVIVAPNLTWGDINSSDTPALFSLVNDYAVANMVETRSTDWSSYEQMPRFQYLQVDYTKAADIDAYIRSVVRTLKPLDTLVVTNSPALSKGSFPIDSYSLFILRDTDDTGLLTSTTTHHRGLITTGDAIGAIRALIAAPQRMPGNLTISPLTHYWSADSRLHAMDRDNAIAEAMQASQPAATTVITVLLVLTLLISTVLLFLEVNIKARALEYLLPIARVLWLVLLSCPLACMLMFVVLPSHVDAEIALDYFVFCIAGITSISMIIALVLRWRISYLLLLAATILAFLIDQLTGGLLSVGGYLSYAPLEGVRYYGIGNEGSALFFGAWVVFCALILTWYRSSRIAGPLRAWLFPLGSIIVIFVIAAPWFGANFGVLIWGIVGAFVAWRHFNHKHVTIVQVIVAIVISGLIALVVLALDTSLNSGSHMGSQIDFSAGGIIEQIAGMFATVFEYGIDTIVYNPVLTILFIAAFALVIYLDRKQPGHYEEFWRSHQSFHGAFRALILTGIIMLLIEDSGIYMPALLLIYPISGLLWLICDYHSWHIRDWLQRKTRLEINSFNPVDVEGDIT